MAIYLAGSRGGIEAPALRYSLRRRVLIAFVIGVAGGLLSYAFVRRPGFFADFIYPWAAARALLAGENPYHVLSGGHPNPFQAPLFYPLPAVLAVTPLAALPFPVATALFFGISSALLAFALTRDGYHRLPMFIGGPFIIAASLGQWAPLIMAAALIPGAGWMAILKPNIGLALTAYRPRRSTFVGCALALVVSLVVIPTWPADWLRSLIIDRAEHMHPIPFLITGGPLLMLAIMRWRTPEGRLLLAMTLVPQKLFFYDQLPLGLVARDFRESLVLSMVSGVGALVWIATTTEASREAAAVPYVFMMLYLPALVVVLRQRPVARRRHAGRERRTVEASSAAES
jgi:hypothetical protein